MTTDSGWPITHLRKHPERNAPEAQNEVVTEVRVQSKGRSITMATTMALNAPFDCAQIDELNPLGNKRAPLRVLLAR